MPDRRQRTLAGGLKLGVALGASFDVMLFIAQRFVNFMVIHGAIRDTVGWTTGSAPISILTSPLTLLLGLIAGVLIGVGVGAFAAAVIPHETPSSESRTGASSQPDSASG